MSTTVTVWSLVVDSDEITPDVIYDTAWVTFVLSSEDDVYAKIRELYAHLSPPDDDDLLVEFVCRHSTLYFEPHQVTVGAPPLDGEYRVRWAIDIAGVDSPRDAAREALIVQRDDDSTAVAIEVEGSDGTTLVDLIGEVA